MQYRSRSRTTISTATQHAVIGAFRPGIRPPALEEIRLFLRNTPALTTSPTAGFAVGIVRSTAVGTGTLTQNVGQPMRGSGGMEAGVGSFVTNWGTAVPTIGGTPTYFDSGIGGTQLGYPVVFTFDKLDPLAQPDSGDPTAEICIALLEAHTTAPIFDVVCLWDE